MAAAAAVACLCPLVVNSVKTAEHRCKGCRDLVEGFKRVGSHTHTPWPAVQPGLRDPGFDGGSIDPSALARAAAWVCRPLPRSYGSGKGPGCMCVLRGFSTRVEGPEVSAAASAAAAPLPACSPCPGAFEAPDGSRAVLS